LEELDSINVIYINTNGNIQIDWANACKNNSQNWSPSTSEMIDVQLSPGNNVSFSLCDHDGHCNNLDARDLGIVIKVNGTLIEYQEMPDGNWDFSHICPV